MALDNANGRMKDFYEVCTCSRHLNLDNNARLKAIIGTLVSSAQEEEPQTENDAALCRTQSDRKC